MAATDINSVSIVVALDNPVDITTGAVADITNGNATPNGGNMRLIVQNTGSATDTISITRTATIDGATVAARTATIAAGKTVVLGPFDPTVFGSRLQYKATAVTTKFIPVTS